MGEKLYSIFKGFCFNVAKSNTMQDAVPYIPERNFKYMFFELVLILVVGIFCFVLEKLITYLRNKKEK